MQAELSQTTGMVRALPTPLKLKPVPSPPISSAKRGMKRNDSTASTAMRMPRKMISTRMPTSGLAASLVTMKGFTRPTTRPAAPYRP